MQMGDLPQPKHLLPTLLDTCEGAEGAARTMRAAARSHTRALVKGCRFAKGLLQGTSHDSRHHGRRNRRSPRANTPSRCVGRRRPIIDAE